MEQIWISESSNLFYYNIRADPNTVWGHEGPYFRKSILFPFSLRLTPHSFIYRVMVNSWIWWARPCPRFSTTSTICMPIYWSWHTFLRYLPNSSPLMDLEIHQITSPTFRCTHVKEDSLMLHYSPGRISRGSIFCPLVVGMSFPWPQFLRHSCLFTLYELFVQDWSRALAMNSASRISL